MDSPQTLTKRLERPQLTSRNSGIGATNMAAGPCASAVARRCSALGVACGLEGNASVRCVSLSAPVCRIASPKQPGDERKERRMEGTPARTGPNTGTLRWRGCVCAESCRANRTMTIRCCFCCFRSRFTVPSLLSSSSSTSATFHSFSLCIVASKSVRNASFYSRVPKTTDVTNVA